MKNSFLAALFILLCSCSKNPPPEPISLWQESFQYYANMQIDSMSNNGRTYYTIADSGKQDVFVYRNETGMNNEIYDDEYSLSITFPVDQGINSFSYTDGEIKKRLGHYKAGGAWAVYADTLIDKGTISGTKNNDGSWNIEIDIWLPKPDNMINTDHIMSRGVYMKTVRQL